MGRINVTSAILAGPNGPNCRLSKRSHDPYHTDGTIHSCWPTVATSCTPHIWSHCMRRATPRFLAVRLSSCLRLQRLCMRRMHPMMPGLDNHLVGLHRALSCYHSRNCSWRALPIRGVCWPRAGVRRGGSTCPGSEATRMPEQPWVPAARFRWAGC